MKWIVFFASIEPVGGVNENNELKEFYKTHNSANAGEQSITQDTVQVKNYNKNMENYKNSRNTLDLRVPVTNSPEMMGIIHILKLF